MKIKLQVNLQVRIKLKYKKNHVSLTFYLNKKTFLKILCNYTYQ